MCELALIAVQFAKIHLDVFERINSLTVLGVFSFLLLSIAIKPLLLPHTHTQRSIVYTVSGT